jgi:hypothetical protein
MDHILLSSKNKLISKITLNQTILSLTNIVGKILQYVYKIKLVHYENILYDLSIVILLCCIKYRNFFINLIKFKIALLRTTLDVVLI